MKTTLRAAALVDGNRLNQVRNVNHPQYRSHGSTQSGRLTLGWRPSPSFTAYLTYQHLEADNTQLQQVVGAWRDEADLRTRAHNLRSELGLDAVLLTRSEEGMTLFDADGQLHVEAHAREVFDVTGAGDTVIATMAAMVAAGLTLREALPWANRAGGVVVGKFGTATVSYEELMA